MKNFILHVISQLIGRWLEPISEPPGLSHKPIHSELVSQTFHQNWEEIQEVLLRRYPHSKASRLLYQNVKQAAWEHLLQCEAHRARVMTISDCDYPQLLRQIENPPLSLTCWGDVGLFQKPLLSVVGSRKASKKSFWMAHDLGEYFSSRGWGIVSGGAYGCDIASHMGVLNGWQSEKTDTESMQEGVPAISVFAGGLAHLYPKGNQSVFRRLAHGRGLFLSERLWTQPSKPRDFLARNRIIAGLSTHLLLVQAAQKSGAMLTAKIALDQGREVLCYGGMEGDIRSDGAHLLISEGAMSFCSPEDAYIKILS